MRAWWPKSVLLLFVAFPAAAQVAPALTGETLSAGGNVECQEELTTFREATAAGSKKTAWARMKALEAFKSCLVSRRAASLARAAAPSDVTSNLAAQQVEMASLAASEKGIASPVEFMGLRFGVGVGVARPRDHERRVSEAELVGDQIEAKKLAGDWEPRIILETHYYGLCRWEWCGPFARGKVGIGPYFGVTLSSDELLSAVTAGVMLGVKDEDPERSEGFSLGFGWLLEKDVTRLAPGFDPGKPLPPGEDGIRYVTKPDRSIVVFATRTF